MGDTLESLILDLLAWLAPRERSYEEVMDAWRTSCPKFPVWEDANDRGLVECHRLEGGGSVVCVSRLGREFLDIHRPQRAVRWHA